MGEDIFERAGLELSEEHKAKLTALGEAAYVQSNGHFGLDELIQFVTTTTSALGHVATIQFLAMAASENNEAGGG